MVSLKTIAHIQSDFPTKFGIPRQSGLVRELRASIVFESEYRNPDALRGLESFSHVWLIWGFSEARRETWSPTVRPPRLGGNTRMGVFATRSPFRPNPIGLSSVEVEKIEQDPDLGPVIHVLGADLMDGTPIYDIKPYIPYCDSHPDAISGFAAGAPTDFLRVRIDDSILENWESMLTEGDCQVLTGLLAQDPRPRYQEDPARIYGMEFSHIEVKFSVDGDTLTVVDILERLKNTEK